MNARAAIALSAMLATGVARAQDCNANGLPDTDEIALDPALDCDNNGVLDWCQTRPIVDRLFPTASPLGGDPTLFSLDTLPEVAIDPVADAGATVTIDFEADGDLSHFSEFVEIVLLGEVVARAFDDSFIDCQMSDTSVEIPATALEAARLAGAPLELRYSSNIDPAVCPGSNITPRLIYRTIDRALDADGDALLDTCGSCPADLAEPFGQLSFADISAFLAAFTSSAPAADLADPRGQFTFADITAFLASFSAGCP